MAKQNDVIVYRGKITDAGRGANFKVMLEGGHIINAKISGKMRQNNIHIILDDTVDVECSLYDMNSGRIIYRV